jgi:hypothetical protein
MLGRLGVTSEARSLYVCLLGLLAAGSYYLSRSHDNNILNLFPLLILVLLAMLSGIEATGRERGDFERGLVQTVLAAMIAFVATFNFGPWRDGVAQHGLVELGPGRLIGRFTPTHHDVPSVLTPDAVTALEYLRGRRAGTIVLLNESAIMLWSPPGKQWTGVNNVANFEVLPDTMIERYIRRGAIAYHRPGWILVDDAKYGHWVDMFKTAYDVREQESLGSYSAYYLVPR